MDTLLTIAAVALGFALFLFSFERGLWRIYLQVRVRFSWFPQRKFILFVCPASHPERSYVEREIIPGLGGSAEYLVSGGPMRGRGNRDERLRYALARAFMEPDREGPVAIIFKPGYEVSRFDFSDALAALGEGTDTLAVTRRERLYKLAGSLEEEMRLYV